MSDEFNSLEERFLQQLDVTPLPVSELLTLLDRITEAGDTARADALAELMQESLTAQSDPAPADILALLRRRAARRDDTGYRKEAEDLCRQFQPGGHDLTKYCGFDGNLPLMECLERLERLLALVPGRYCYNKSWGFGVIRDRNDFTGRFIVDFDRKPGHGLGFAYAAESFSLPDEDHPLARRHRDQAQHETLRREQPGELLKNVLRHYGPMNAVLLEETMIRDLLVPADEWKTFWAESRRALKNDPSVIVPSRKNEPLQFMNQPHERFNDGWLAALAGTNEPDRILEAIAERENDSDEPVTSEEKLVFSERLTHVLQASLKPLPLVDSLLMAHRLALPVADGIIAAGWQQCCKPDFLKTILADLSLRKLRLFLEEGLEQKGDAMIDALLKTAPSASPRVTTLLVDFLQAHDLETRLADSLRPGLQGHEQASAAWILYFLRNPDFAERLELVSKAMLPSLAVALLEFQGAETRKTREAPAEFLCRASQLRRFGDAMTAEQRHDLIRRLHLLTQGANVELARSVMAAWIKTYPDLASAVAPAHEEEDEEKETVRLTSWRSWHEKQRQLDHLIRKEIPANAREIGVARSYGDLRENHEYKSAKEHQTILYRRQEELEQDIAAVKGTDFVGLPHDRAGMATTVRLRQENGREETVVILGEWDNEPALNIISCRSERAQRLTGTAPGDKVLLPGDNGTEETATVLSVDPLPEPVKEWMKA